jgi:hypothetical protein
VRQIRVESLSLLKSPRCGPNGDRMATPINIFVCHKKLLIREKDGLKSSQENAKASILHAILQTYPDRYDPWIDDSEIGAGMAWESEIYSRLLVSDVLLLAIGPGTSKSEWVRREIALAKALGVAIVPLGYDMMSDEFGAELKGPADRTYSGEANSEHKIPSQGYLASRN